MKHDMDKKWEQVHGWKYIKWKIVKKWKTIRVHVNNLPPKMDYGSRQHY